MNSKIGNETAQSGSYWLKLLQIGSEFRGRLEFEQCAARLTAFCAMLVSIGSFIVKKKRRVSDARTDICLQSVKCSFYLSENF